MNRPSSTLTTARLADLPPVVDLTTAAQALGIGRTTAYVLARSGTFPCRVIRAGRIIRVPTAELLRVLGLHEPVHADPDR